MMQIITSNQIIGTHCWPYAPEKYSYLANEHRHIFFIRCWFDVSNYDREIEINHMQDIIENQIKRDFGYREGTGADFVGMSCESIAEYCIKTFHCSACEVLEDGFGGAYVRK